MNTLQRLVRTINYNFVLYSVAVGAVLYAISSQYVTDAIVNFSFAGIVPGTDIVLSPDDMVLGVTLILGGLIVAALALWLARMVHARRSMSRLIHEAGTPKSRASKKSAVVIVKKEVGKHYRPVARRRVSTQAVDYELAYRLSIILSSLGASLRQDFRYVGDMFGGIYWLILGIVWFVVRSLARVIVIIAMVVSIGFVSLWSVARKMALWLEPYVRRFDGWLEAQTKTAMALARKKMKHSQSMQVFGLMVHDSKASLRNFFK